MPAKFIIVILIIKYHEPKRLFQMRICVFILATAVSESILFSDRVQSNYSNSMKLFAPYIMHLYIAANPRTI